MHPVLIINLSKWYGGAELRVFDMANSFHGNIEYSVAALENSPLYKKLYSKKLNVFGLPYRRSNPLLALSLVQLIRKHGYRIIDMHNPQSNFWGIAASQLTGTPGRVTTVHSSRDATVTHIKSVGYEKTQQLNHLLSSHFIAVSKSVFDYLLKLGIKRESITLIPNGIKIPPEDLRSLPTPFRNSLGWKEDTFLLTVVGRLEPIKGHIYLLKALQSVVAQYQNIRCLVVGKGRSASSLKEYSLQMGLENYVHFAGFRDDISAILSESDAFCMPSLSEGLPYALLEACSHKLPLVVTRVGGMAEMLTDNKTALLVQPQSPDGLAGGIIHLLDNPDKARRMGETAFRLVRDRYSIESMIHQTLRVYEAVEAW